MLTVTSNGNPITYSNYIVIKDTNKIEYLNQNVINVTERAGSGRLRPGSNSFIVFMYSFQKLWLKTSTRDVIC